VSNGGEKGKRAAHADGSRNGCQKECCGGQFVRLARGVFVCPTHGTPHICRCLFVCVIIWCCIRYKLAGGRWRGVSRSVLWHLTLSDTI
jgi:hypothetical protein